MDLDLHRSLGSVVSVFTLAAGRHWSAACCLTASAPWAAYCSPASPALWALLWLLLMVGVSSGLAFAFAAFTALADDARWFRDPCQQRCFGQKDYASIYGFIGTRLPYRHGDHRYRNHRRQGRLQCSMDSCHHICGVIFLGSPCGCCRRQELRKRTPTSLSAPTLN